MGRGDEAEERSEIEHIATQLDTAQLEGMGAPHNPFLTAVRQLQEAVLTYEVYDGRGIRRSITEQESERAVNALLDKGPLFDRYLLLFEKEEDILLESAPTREALLGRVVSCFTQINYALLGVSDILDLSTPRPMVLSAEAYFADDIKADPRPELTLWQQRLDRLLAREPYAYHSRGQFPRRVAEDVNYDKADRLCLTWVRNDEQLYIKAAHAAVPGIILNEVEEFLRGADAFHSVYDLYTDQAPSVVVKLSVQHLHPLRNGNMHRSTTRTFTLGVTR